MNILPSGFPYVNQIQVNIILTELHNRTQYAACSDILFAGHVPPSCPLFVPSENFLSRITAATLFGDLRYLSVYIMEIQQNISLRRISPTQI